MKTWEEEKRKELISILGKSFRYGYDYIISSQEKLVIDQVEKIVESHMSLAFDKGFHKGFEEGQKSIKNKMADYVNKKF